MQEESEQRSMTLKLGKLSLKYTPEGMRNYLAKKGFAEVNLLAHWEKIAGRGLAKYCVPEHIRTLSGERILSVKVFETRVIECQHQKQDMLERIYMITGYKIIDDIKFIRTQKMPQPKYRTSRIAVNVPATTHPFWQEQKVTIQDSDLKKAFNHLAHFVIPVKNKQEPQQIRKSLATSVGGFQEHLHKTTSQKSWVLEWKKNN